MNITEFISMGGYGPFVWSSIGLTLMMIIFEIITVRKQFNKVVQRIKRIQQIRKVDAAGETS